MDAHARMVGGLDSGDVAAIQPLLADDGFLVMSLDENRVRLSLTEWLPHFERMIRSGVELSVNEREVRSGGGADAGWVFALQEMTWSRPDNPDSRTVALWNTTEVWERRGGSWQIVHVHHSLAPAPGTSGESRDADDD